MVKSVLFILFSSLTLIGFSNGTFSGKVTAVIDGNTVEITSETNEVHKIILAGIDSPELTQEYGDEAKRYLEKLAMKKEVTIVLQGKDRKGNHLAIVLIKGKIDARVELLKEGLAWTAEKDPLPELEAHRTEAQEKGKGLWVNSKPTPPWTHRRQQSMLQPKTS